MMTVTIKQKKIGKFYIWVDVEFPDGYEVYHVRLYDNGRLWNENYYGNERKKQAMNCYYRYCSKAKKWHEILQPTIDWMEARNNK